MDTKKILYHLIGKIFLPKDEVEKHIRDIASEYIDLEKINIFDSPDEEECSISIYTRTSIDVLEGFAKQTNMYVWHIFSIYERDDHGIQKQEKEQINQGRS